MTPGERAVWAAVYAAEWVRTLAMAESGVDLDRLAANACLTANWAVRSLRKMTETDLGHAREIINGGES